MQSTFSLTILLFNPQEYRASRGGAQSLFVVCVCCFGLFCIAVMFCFLVVLFCICLFFVVLLCVFFGLSCIMFTLDS